MACVSTEVTAPAARGFRTIRGRLLFWVLAVTVPIYAATLYLSYQSAAERLEAGAARDADDLASTLAASLDTVIRPIEGGVRTVAYQLEEVDPPREEYPLRIHGILAAWPDVYGSTIATEVNGQDPQSRPFAPYYFLTGPGFDVLWKILAQFCELRQHSHFLQQPLRRFEIEPFRKAMCYIIDTLDFEG